MSKSGAVDAAAAARVAGVVVDVHGARVDHGCAQQGREEQVRGRVVSLENETRVDPRRSSGLVGARADIIEAREDLGDVHLVVEDVLGVQHPAHEQGAREHDRGVGLGGAAHREDGRALPQAALQGD